jgi:hypothetical protein
MKKSFSPFPGQFKLLDAVISNDKVVRLQFVLPNHRLSLWVFKTSWTCFKAVAQDEEAA